MDSNNIISQRTGAKVSRMSQAYSQAVSHGEGSMCSEWHFKTFFLTRTCIKTKTKPSSLPLDLLLHGVSSEEPPGLLEDLPRQTGGEPVPAQVHEAELGEGGFEL